jgi:hypothetical protein
MVVSHLPHGSMLVSCFSIGDFPSTRWMVAVPIKPKQKQMKTRANLLFENKKEESKCEKENEYTTRDFFGCCSVSFSSLGECLLSSSISQFLKMEVAFVLSDLFYFFIWVYSVGFFKSEMVRDLAMGYLHFCFLRVLRLDSM